jgi:hypothetical protein
MDKIEIISLENAFGKTIDHVIIDRGNGEFTSMHKADYDRLKAEQSTPIVIDETKTK